MTLAGHRERLSAKKTKWLEEEEIELRVRSERNLELAEVGPAAGHDFHCGSEAGGGLSSLRICRRVLIARSPKSPSSSTSLAKGEQGAGKSGWVRVQRWP